MVVLETAGNPRHLRMLDGLRRGQNAALAAFVGNQAPESSWME
jgi:hypothetical protein